jgi:hypothetical protein
MHLRARPQGLCQIPSGKNHFPHDNALSTPYVLNSFAVTNDSFSSTPNELWPLSEDDFAHWDTDAPIL